MKAFNRFVCILMCSIIMLLDTSFSTLCAQAIDFNFNIRTYDIFFYNIKTGHITDVNESEGRTDIVIPEEINGIAIVGIDELAFSLYPQLKTVKIPDSVVSIADNAFENTGSVIVCNPNSYAEQWAKNHGLKYRVPNASLIGLDTNQTRITVYKNNKTQSEDSGEYILCDGAAVDSNGHKYSTDSIGEVVIDDIDNGVTVSKAGYVTKNVSNAQLKKNKTIYLQKDEGEAPIINGVIVDDVDVLTHEYEIDLLSKEKINLQAEIIWKSGAYQKLYLMQEGRRVDFTNNTLDTVLSDNFDVADDIYIVAEDKVGHSTKQKLSFQAGGGVIEAVNKYKLSFGDKIGGTIPGSVPILGGNDVGIDIPFLPLNVTFENNKFYATLGIDVDKYQSKDSWATSKATHNTAHVLSKKNKTLFTNIKGDFKSAKDSWNLKKMTQKFKTAAKYGQGSFGFTADFLFIGYVEGYVGSNGQVDILDGGLIFNPSVKVDVGSQIWYVPPVYWEASIKGEIEAMYNIYLNNTAQNFMPRGSIGGKVTLKGGLGLGVSGAAGISGGAEGSIGLKYDMYEKSSNNYFAVTGSIGAYAKIFIGPVTLLDKSFPFAEGIIWDHPSTRVSLAGLNDVTSIDLMDESEYKLIDREYINNTSDFVANDISVELMSIGAQSKIEKLLKTNIYTYSEPQIVEFENSDKLVVWLDDNADREDINRTSLYYSYYSNNVWTVPKQIMDDGTADFMPQLKLIDNKAYLVWINSNTVLDNTTNLNEIASTWDITSAVFDGVQFSNVNNIIANDALDMMPVVFGKENQIYAAWVSNSNNSVFGTDSDNTIMYSQLINGHWSSPKKYKDNLFSVDSLDGAVIDGKMSIAYSVDSDGNIDDSSDKEIYYNNKKITQNNVLDSKAVFNSNNLYWYSEGNIIEYDCITGTSHSILPEEISTDRFVVISDEKNKAIVFTDPSGLERELCAYIYDTESRLWGNKTQLSDLNSNISSYSGLFANDGDMYFVINKTAIVGEIDDINPYGQTDLATFSVTPSCDLSLDDVYFDESTTVPGNSIEFSLQVTNKGEKAVDNYTVDIINEAGTVLSSTPMSDVILPGNTQEIIVNYVMSEDDISMPNMRINLNVDNEVDETNNTFEVCLEYTDIAIEDVLYGMNEVGEAVISGNIVNRGYGKCKNIKVNLREQTADGKIIDSYTSNIELGNLDIAPFRFYVPYVQDKVYYVTISADDMMAGNNEGFVVLNNEGVPKLSDVTTSTVILGNQLNVNINDLYEDAVLIAVVYDSDNRMLSVTTKNVNSETNNVALPVDLSSATKVKILLWNSVEEMIPLSEGEIILNTRLSQNK